MTVPPELLHHLSERLGVERHKARRVVEEVLSFYGETAQDFVVRRHAELQRERRRNREIFSQIRSELGDRRFSQPALSERQLRRWIYG